MHTTNVVFSHWFAEIYGQNLISLQKELSAYRNIAAVAWFIITYCLLFVK